MAERYQVTMCDGLAECESETTLERICSGSEDIRRRSGSLLYDVMTFSMNWDGLMQNQSRGFEFCECSEEVVSTIDAGLDPDLIDLSELWIFWPTTIAPILFLPKVDWGGGIEKCG